LEVRGPGLEPVLATIGPGDIVGEGGFLDGQEAPATVTATTPVRAMRIPYAVLRLKLESDQVFAARFFRALSMLLSSRLRQQHAVGMVGERELDPQLARLTPGAADMASLFTRVCALHAGRPAYRAGGRDVTYEECWIRASRLARRLRRMAAAAPGK